TGAVVSVAGATLTDTNPGTDPVWRLDFAAQHRPGTYTLRVGPDVRDRAGNPMNQNHDTTFGQAGDSPGGDRFVGTFFVQGLAVSSIAPTNPVLTPAATAS